MIKELNIDELKSINTILFDNQKLEEEFKVNPFAHVLVYLEKDKVVGYIYYSEIYERIEINQFEVDFFHRNCGIGTKLLEKVTEIVDKGITLEVKKSNHNAINLYKKFNFVEKAKRIGYYNGEDAILMEREVRE